MPTPPNIDSSNPRYYLIVSNDAIHSKQGNLRSIVIRAIPKETQAVVYIDWIRIFKPDNTSEDSIRIEYRDFEMMDFKYDEVLVNGEAAVDTEDIFNKLIAIL